MGANIKVGVFHNITPVYCFAGFWQMYDA